MNHLKKKLRLSLALPITAGILMLAPVAVYAQRGIDDDTSSTSGKKQESSMVKPASNDDVQKEATETDDSGADSLRDQAEQLVAAKRAGVKAHTAEHKKKSCESRAANINKRADKYATQAQKHLDVFNKIFMKVQAIQATKQLDVANYDALVATATDKQAAAQAAVDALKALDITIDCTQAEPATAVATLKAATKNARTALHEYRTSIKDIGTALKGAAATNAEASTTTDGGNQ